MYLNKVHGEPPPPPKKIKMSLNTKTIPSIIVMDTEHEAYVNFMVGDIIECYT